MRVVRVPEQSLPDLQEGFGVLADVGRPERVADEGTVWIAVRALLALVVLDLRAHARGALDRHVTRALDVQRNQTAPRTLPWPFAWLHAPKTGSHFGAAVADLLCDGLHGFVRYKGTELVEGTAKEWRAGRTRCAADAYFGRATTVELLPHCVRGHEQLNKLPPYCVDGAVVVRRRPLPVDAPRRPVPRADAPRRPAPRGPPA